ncbi:IclR family transcriptional regulator [Acidihalobacter yilgarnensis]|uniref:HTH-type transcriptional repressor AllR n=1 Tax=Acidihalobacter yilgarnensis TaxID=2819280 RepID=A0A1D8IN20_9GAMM|nr:IclR family transcriptional regulator [Acidihalobacter yilgarnensis]AOU97857.1 IclR family transcriptional regulator [Acidihalobacter yilgarnensis]
MSKSVNPIQVIERSATLLDTIAALPEAASLKILSAETGLHPSTAFRILASLTETGFVERDAAGRYVLGRKLLQLAGRVRRGIDIREEARVHMEWLRDQIGETVNLTVREGDEVIYIERVAPKRMMRVEQVIGSRAPLHVTAVGKLMLGELGDAFLHAYVQRTGLPAYTPKTITSAERLLAVVHAAGSRGIALDDEEAEEGVGCIGTLIHDSTSAVVAGLSISAPMERRQDAWVPLVRDAGRRIAERLGYFED